MSERREMITLTGAGFAWVLLGAFLAGAGLVLTFVAGTSWGLLPWFASLPIFLAVLTCADDRAQQRHQ